MPVENTIEACERSEEQPRTTFARKFDFVLNLFGMSIGLGNVWRFPYLCYKNGGGVFLIAYFSLLLLLILPMVVMECALGQYSGHSSIKAWRIVPLLRGIGYTAPVIMFFCNVYYPVLLGWALRWFVASFSSDLPWTNCDNSWNTKNCIPLFEKSANSSMVNSSTPTDDMLKVKVHQENFSEDSYSSVEEFWRRNLIGLTSGLEDDGGIKWDMFWCLLVIWILTYFAVWKGIGWTSKVVYVTATLPIVMLFIVVIRGATLEGALDGITLYLKPNISKLAEIELWTDAASQVLFSFRVGSGGLTTLSAFNEYNHNVLRDSVIFSATNAGTSFVSGFAIFSVLGYLARAKNTTIAVVAESGPGLVFVVYPTALSLLPLPQLWSATFFLMIIMLGFDSQFVLQEALMSCGKDLFPRLFRHKWSHEINLAILSTIMFIFGISMVTRGGIYVLHIFNNYSAAGWCIYFVVISETIALSWMYGADKFCDNLRDMMGYEIPRLWFKFCWKFATPLVATALLLYSLISYKPLVYDRAYVYPVWANLFGWATALSSLLWIPGTAIYVLLKAEGSTILEKLKNSIKTPNYYNKGKMDVVSEPRKIDEKGSELELEKLHDC